MEEPEVTSEDIQPVDKRDAYVVDSNQLTLAWCRQSIYDICPPLISQSILSVPLQPVRLIQDSQCNPVSSSHTFFLFFYLTWTRCCRLVASSPRVF